MHTHTIASLKYLEQLKTSPGSSENDTNNMYLMSMYYVPHALLMLNNSQNSPVEGLPLSLFS